MDFIQPSSGGKDVPFSTVLPERFLFYPAHFWHHENHLRLIEAFSKVAREAPELKLGLTGKQQEAYPAVIAAIDKSD